MKLEHLRTVALVGQSAEPRVADCMLSLAPHLAARGIRVLAQDAISGSVTPCAESDFAHEADLLIAIGGDGTLLRAARLTVARPIPLIGINHGRLGFLTDISPNSMLQDLDGILEGRHIEDQRALLEAELISDGAPGVRGLALNDVVLQKVGTGRILDFETAIDGRFVNAHRGDGLVIATATGSTAYALSCSGPVVVPDLDVLVLAPICPHTLSDRPLVVRADGEIEVRLTEPSSATQVICDGQVLGPLSAGDRLLVRKARQPITLLHPLDYDYYRLLRSKLHWGRGR